MIIQLLIDYKMRFCKNVIICFLIIEYQFSLQILNIWFHGTLKTVHGVSDNEPGFPIYVLDGYELTRYDSRPR